MGTATLAPPPRPRAAEGLAPEHDPAVIAQRIRVHLWADGPSPEARYFAATGRYPNDE